MIVEQLAAPSTKPEGAPALEELRLCETFPIGEARVKAGTTGKKVLVVHGKDDAYYATDFHCFHAGGELGQPEDRYKLLHSTDVQPCKVDIEDAHYLRCPLHQRKINLKTGEEVGALSCQQRVHPCRVENGYVLVDKRSVKHDDHRRFASDQQNRGGKGVTTRNRNAVEAVAKRSRVAPYATPPANQTTMHRFFTPVAEQATADEDTQDIDLTPGDGIDAQMTGVIDLTSEDLEDLPATQPDDPPLTQPFYSDDPPLTQPDGDVDMG